MSHHHQNGGFLFLAASQEKELVRQAKHFLACLTIPPHDADNIHAYLRAKQRESTLNRIIQGKSYSIGTIQKHCPELLDYFGAADPVPVMELDREPKGKLAAPPIVERIALPLDPEPKVKLAAPVVCSIKLHGSLIVSAEKARKLVPFRLWALARVLDHAGKGWVSLDELRAALASGGNLAYAKRDTVNNHIRKAARQGFGEIGAGKFFYRKEAKIAYLLGMDCITGKAVEVPVSALLGDFVEIRALALDCFHSSQNGTSFANPIARETITQEITGRSKPTQIKYAGKKLAGIGTRSNYLQLKLIDQKEVDYAYQKVAYEWQETEDKSHQIRVLRSHDNKPYLALVKQLPNSYAGNFETVHSRKKWINRQLKKLRSKGVGKPIAANWRMDVSQKLYTTVNEIEKLPKKMDKGHLLAHMPALGNVGQHGQVWRKIQDLTER